MVERLILVAIVAAGIAGAAQFEVASIKECAGDNSAGRSTPPPRTSPGRLTLECRSVMQLIQEAYVLFADGRFNYISVPVRGGPSWLDSARYTINAKAEGDPGVETMMGPMLQKLLEDRFQLRIRRDTTQVQVYELTAARRGARLTRVEEGSCTPVKLDRDLAPRAPGQPRPDLCGTGGFSRKPPNATMNLHAMTLDDLAKKLAIVLGRPVIDKTGMAGMFDFRLKFSPDEGTPGMPTQGGGQQPGADDAAPSIFTALQEQLGLKLEQAKGPGESLMIDQLERPSEN
jgi:uncharacterized protein (TIGR03435 family)